MVWPLLVAALVAPALVSAQAPGRDDASRQEAPAATPSPPSELLAEIDAAYERRDEPGVMDEAGKKLQDAERRWPKDYDVLWRLARHHFWLADDPALPKEQKSRLGRLGWEYGDRATVANPRRVEGWHFAAAGMGNYALGIGVISALRQGIESKFKERLSRAEQLEPGFQHGAIQTAWGRFWYELPWPKYSERRSRQALEAALARNPDNVRARVYLAELNLKEDEPQYARVDLEKALAKPPGQYDAPEERRWQAVARRLLEGLGSK